MKLEQCNEFLKSLEEIHAKHHKGDEEYIKRCKASKDLSLKDYHIIGGHTLDEYFNKYGKKLKLGLLNAYKKDELWLMDKNTKYWEIDNNSGFIYFSIGSNYKPLWISLVSLAAVVGITAGVYFGVFANKVKADDESGEGEGGGEEDYGPGSEVISIKFSYSSLVIDNSFYSKISETSQSSRIYNIDLYDTPFNNCYGGVGVNNQSSCSIDNVDATHSFPFTINMRPEYYDGANWRFVESGANFSLTLSDFTDEKHKLNIPDVVLNANGSYATPNGMWFTGPGDSSLSLDLQNYQIHSFLNIGKMTLA